MEPRISHSRIHPSCWQCISKSSKTFFLSSECAYLPSTGTQNIIPQSPSPCSHPDVHHQDAPSLDIPPLTFAHNSSVNQTGLSFQVHTIPTPASTQMRNIILQPSSPRDVHHLDVPSLDNSHLTCHHESSLKTIQLAEDVQDVPHPDIPPLIFTHNSPLPLLHCPENV